MIVHNMPDVKESLLHFTVWSYTATASGLRFTAPPLALFFQLY